jgi:hypothetical protein
MVRNLIRFSFLNNLPYSNSNFPFLFPDFCHGLKRDFHSLDRHYVTTKIVFVTNVVIEILKGQKYALTSDHWKSAGGTTFLAILSMVSGN